MKVKHICPKCGATSGWFGPSKLSQSKLRALLFYLWHGSPCFVDCGKCGCTVSAKQWLNLETVEEPEALFAHPRLLVVRKAGSAASRQDVGRFMKHGHQLPGYRKSVKAKVNPEED